MPKNCQHCGVIMTKPSNCSVAYWSNVAKYCSLDCRYLGMRGYKRSEETKKRMSIAHMGNKSNTGRKLSETHKENMSLAITGEKHWNWQGGLKPLNHRLRSTAQAKSWNVAVKSRDGHKCKIANKDCCGKLEAHHILGWAEYPELRYELNNGITLCRFHHPLNKKDSEILSPFFRELIKTNSFSVLAPSIVGARLGK